MAKMCPICGNKVKLLDNLVLKDGKICADCGEKVGLHTTNMASMNVAEVLTIQNIIDYQESNAKIDPKQYWADYKAGKKQQKADNKAQYEELMNEFKTDNAWHVGKVYFDDKKNQILLKKSMIDGIANEPTRIHEYSDLESYSPIETPTTIEKKHGVGRSIVGGLVAGPTGAVLGAFSGNKSYDAVSKVSMMLYFKDDRREEAVLLNTDTPTSSGTYQAVQKSILNISHDLDKIIAANNPAKPAKPDNAHSSADDLRELKQLLDDGILTEEEFAAKKKQILGI